MATMNIYGAGGAACNILNSLKTYAGQKTDGFAQLGLYYIDTSRSNLDPDVSEDHVYLLEGCDGAGKKRATHHLAIAESANDILHRFKPADVNVVIHSVSGGSGSVYGPTICSALLERGETVIVIMIGSTSSKIETENTVKTLRSYEVISHKREMPVVAYYRENSPDMPRSQVDSEVQTAILILAAIFSGDNRELDSADLKNFINYHHVTSYQPRLAMLEFYSKTLVVPKGHSLVTLVTLVDHATASDVDQHVEYQTVGYLPEATKQNITVDLPIHGCVVSGAFNSIVDTLDARLKSFDEVRKVVVERSIVGADVQHTDIGIIL